MQEKICRLRRRVWRLVVPVLGLLLWQAQPADAFDVAVGDEQSHTYKLGIGMSSLIKIKLLPDSGIDLQPMITDGDQGSLEALQGGLVSFALVRMDNSRSLSPGGIEAVASLGEIDGLTTMLLARSNVDDDAVMQILQTIFANVRFLATVDPVLNGLDPDSAVMGLALPLHGGAKQFHASRWSSFEPASTSTDNREAAVIAAPDDSGTVSAQPATEEGSADARNYVVYFGFDDAELNQEAQATLEKAANFASTLEAPAVMVAAYTDSVGDAEYNYLLAERRASSVMQAIDALDVRYSRIDLSLFGERSPWSVTLDDVDEASNRRVELFIEEPVPEARTLPMPADYRAEAPPDDLSIPGGYGGPALPIPPEPAETPANRPLAPKPLM